MSLNIKNDETHHLAHQLSLLTGESLTSAVTIALRERLSRLTQNKQTPLTEELLRIGEDCAAHLKAPFNTIDHGALLYDEKGLPR